MKLITRALNKLGLFTSAQYRASIHEADRLRGDIRRLDERIEHHNDRDVTSITREQQLSILNNQAPGCLYRGQQNQGYSLWKDLIG